MKKVEFCTADYDYTKTYPDIDYSQRVTESGLVLSMRQIYERYASMGVDLLHGEYVDDDQDPDDTMDQDFDDPLDMLQTSMAIKAREIPARKKQQPDGKQPDGKQRKGDTPDSATGAPGPKGQAQQVATKSPRQSEVQRNDGADEQ